MPRKAANPCRVPGCPGIAVGRSGYCEKHQDQGKYGRKKTYHSYQRGADREWRKIRIEVLRSHGIPQEDWPKYVIDHRPPYDPAIEPDHRNYTLVPMIRGKHSQKTNKFDGGWGNRKKQYHGEGG